MKHRNIFAFTANGPEPQFMSVNVEADGSITFHLRSPKDIGGQAQCPLDRDLARELGFALLTATETPAT